MSGTYGVQGEAVEALLGRIADEFTDRCLRGECPEVEEYAGRHPQIADVLRQVLPALQVVATPGLSRPGRNHPEDSDAASDSDQGSADGSVAQALREYRAALETGRHPPLPEILARHPGISGELAACLGALDLVDRVGPGLYESSPAPLTGPDIRPGIPLGDYRILRPLGQGGMGVVYEAEQLSLSRRVALKVLPLAATLDPRQLRRFKNEAQAAAGLDHPHIVPIHAVGCERGVHFYAMQLIEGQTLADAIHELRRHKGLEAPAGSGTALDPPTARHTQESGVRSQESGVRSQESGIRSQPRSGQLLLTPVP
jgi:eukaryotic-like serine/threonine-protein kinase